MAACLPLASVWVQLTLARLPLPKMRCSLSTCSGKCGIRPVEATAPQPHSSFEAGHHLPDASRCECWRLLDITPMRHSLQHDGIGFACHGSFTVFNLPVIGKSLQDFSAFHRPAQGTRSEKAYGRNSRAQVVLAMSRLQIKERACLHDIS